MPREKRRCLTVIFSPLCLGFFSGYPIFPHNTRPKNDVMSLMSERPSDLPHCSPEILWIGILSGVACEYDARFCDFRKRIITSHHYVGKRSKIKNCNEVRREKKLKTLCNIKLKKYKNHSVINEIQTSLVIIFGGLMLNHHGKLRLCL